VQERLIDFQKNDPELKNTMKHVALILLLAASTAAASAQTPAKPATAAKPATTAAKPAATAAKPATTAGKLPPGVPVVKGIPKTLFSLRYQEIKIGTGAGAEPGKMYRVLYTGWLGANGRADDGRKFDSSDDHPRRRYSTRTASRCWATTANPSRALPSRSPFLRVWAARLPALTRDLPA